VWLVGPVTVIGCVVLYLALDLASKLVLFGWGAIGLVVYFLYSRSRSHVGLGHIEVHELDPEVPQLPIPPMPRI
jgi:APA family basic amino acid/polyamine antiporter